jgi:hypothetical protein
MVKIDTNNPPQTNQQTSSSTNPKEESGLIKTIGQLLPLAPFVFEQFTGQKVPPMSGTMAEIQLALTNLQTNLQAVVNNQQQLMQRIVNLETNASQQLNNLVNQFQSFRLTHTREKKEIAYNNPPPQEEENY